MNLKKENFDAMDRKGFLGQRLRNQASPVIPEPVMDKFAGQAIISVSITNSRTASPVGAFPIPLFLSAYVNAYASLLQNVPAGYTLTITDVGNNKVFDYDDTTNACEFTVSSSTTAYQAILARFLNSRYKVSITRMAVLPTTNAANQFAQTYEAATFNVLGKTDRNPLDIDTAQDPQNFQNNIILLKQPYILSPESGVIVFVDAATDSIQLNFTSSEYELS